MRQINWTERNALAAAITLYQSYEGFTVPIANKNAWIIGLTGVAGVGKSTLMESLIEYFRSKDLRVVVLAIDPSSTKNGGALLGDRQRIRNPKLDADKGLFFRSLASHGEKSALTNALPKIIKYSKLFSDIVIVETAGAGQTDIEIRDRVDTLMQVIAPLGDALNLAKDGQNEYTDIFVVNGRESFKDNKKFFTTASMVLGQEADENGWTKKIFLINAREKKGIAELIEGLYAHKKFLEKTKPRE